MVIVDTSAEQYRDHHVDSGWLFFFKKKTPFLHDSL